MTLLASHTQLSTNTWQFMLLRQLTLFAQYQHKIVLTLLLAEKCIICTFNWTYKPCYSAWYYGKMVEYNKIVLCDNNTTKTSADFINFLTLLYCGQRVDKSLPCTNWRRAMQHQLAATNRASKILKETSRWCDGHGPTWIGLTLSSWINSDFWLKKSSWARFEKD